MRRKGQGYIKPRGKNTFQLQYYTGEKNTAGEYIKRYKTVHGSPTQAQKELTRILNEINTGDYVDPEKSTLADFLRRWLADYAAYNVTPKTLERYNDIIMHINDEIGRYKLSAIKPAQIQAFYTKLLTEGRRDGREGGLSAKTVVQYHAIMHKAFDMAVRWQLLTRNPCDAVSPPRPEKREMAVLAKDDSSAVEGIQVDFALISCGIFTFSRST